MTIICALCLMMAAPLAAGGWPQTQGRPSKPLAAPSSEAAALGQFSDAVAKHLELRARLRGELPPMTVTPRAAEIVGASDALARAVVRARPKAQQGDFFSPAVARLIRQRLDQALRGPERASILASISEEPTRLTRPRIYTRFPEGDVLPTMPAVLLHALPSLPAELEYRFIGTTLVLRDVHASLILDYLPTALPAR